MNGNEVQAKMQRTKVSHLRIAPLQIYSRYHSKHSSKINSV